VRAGCTKIVPSVPYRKAEIRPYRPEDEGLLFGLAKSAFGEEEAWDDSRTLAVLEADTVFVAEVEGSAAGYVAVERAGDSVCIEQLLVSPAHEAEGVGRQLFEFAEGFAISQGARSLQVVVEGENHRAAAFYRSRGCVPSEGDVFELVLPQR
jgi:ribosomal protein S18 acetylase RimI-like enzyme